MYYHFLDVELADRLVKIGEAYDAAIAQRKKTENAFSVVIIGQQNNGKSTLCNALLRDWENRKFPVGDIRLTASTQEEQDETNGILYVDTPGFSSATMSDDETAQAEWIRANLLIFVHSVRSGELDKDEVRVLQRLKSVVPDLERRLFVACSKAGGEQPDELRRKLDRIREQIREHVGMDVTMEAIDSIFYQKGMEKGNEQLAATTNIPKLLDWIAAGRDMPSPLDTVLQQTGEEYEKLLAQAHDSLEAGMEDVKSRRKGHKNKLTSCWTGHKSTVQDAWNNCAKYAR